MTKSKENLLCTDSECIEDNGNHVLKCPKCNRNVHYRCTSLPAYQLQVILLVKKTRNSGYHCQNCVVVSDEIKELVPAKTRMIPLSASKELERLKKENAGHITNKVVLEQIIQDQKTKLTMLKNNLETNPTYHTLEYVEDRIENKLEDLKVSSP